MDLVTNNYTFYRESVCGLISNAKKNKKIILWSQKRKQAKNSRISLLDILIDLSFFNLDI